MVRLAHVCNVHGLQSLAASASGRDAGEVRRERPSAGHPVGGGGGVCLVLGSEGQGVTDEVSSFCEEVAIPMAGGVDSLNVGTAGGQSSFGPHCCHGPSGEVSPLLFAPRHAQGGLFPSFWASS